MSHAICNVTAAGGTFFRGSPNETVVESTESYVIVYSDRLLIKENLPNIPSI